MSTIFSLITITSIWCIGLKIVTNEGMILYSWQKFALYKVESGNKIFEPLILCAWCLPSVYSIIGYLIAYSLGIVTEWKYLFAYPIVVAGSSFATGMSWLVYNILEHRHGYFKNVEQLTHWDMADRSFKHRQRKQQS